MTTLLTNIDDVRAEIMQLENAEIFEQAAWDRVQRALIEQDRPAALADAQRRMATARQNATYIAGVDWAHEPDAITYVVTDLGFPGNAVELVLVPVAVETE